MKKIILISCLAVAFALTGILLSRSVAARQGTIDSSHPERIMAGAPERVVEPRPTASEGPPASGSDRVVSQTPPLPRFVQYMPFRSILDYSHDPSFNPSANQLNDDMAMEWSAILAERNQTLDKMQSTLRARVEDWGTALIKNGNFIDPIIADQIPLEPNTFRVGVIMGAAPRVVTIRPGDSVPLDCLAEDLNSFVGRTERLIRQAFK